MPVESTNKLQVRFARQADLQVLAEMDRQAFGDRLCWSIEDYDSRLTTANHVGWVTEINGDIVAALMVETHKQNRIIRVLRLMVHPSFRRRGIGQALLGKIALKLDDQRYASVSALVDEKNLAGQLFLRACGYTAIGVSGGKMTFMAGLPTLGQRVIERIMAGDCRAM